MKGQRRDEMRCGRFFLMAIFLSFALTSVSFAEDDTLQYFLSKASSKTVELSKKDKVELLSQLDDVMKRAQGICAKLMQAVQTGETEVLYQEGKFWMSKLEEDQASIETGFQQIRLLREKPAHLVASVRLYKSLRDLSGNFNAYNNFSSFSAIVGDLAPEIELWGDPIFFKLYLLPLARSKDMENEAPQAEKKPGSKEKKH
ncbi:MAG TPA: hypothetical protein VEM15_05205 [Thermodesulfobacteriota bacterium]|nr:hypothetical protein [Thermodesulfobacteriota bacterium]